MQFENMEVWRRSARLSSELYLELKNLKDWGFRDQLTRAGLSVPSNIAEGLERTSRKEAVQFLSYAKGSAGEVYTQLYIGIKIGYIEKQTGQRWIDDTKEIANMLGGLITKKRNYPQS